MEQVKPVVDEDLATRLVDEAGRILMTDGASALTLRRLAQAVGVSTMPVYTLFGDKNGLLTAMYRVGFQRLGAAMRAAAEEPTDPMDALAALGRAYRAAALANPHLYGLMFGRPVATFAPEPEAEVDAEATFRPLVGAVQRCLDSGCMAGADAERIAFHLWSVTHGTVSLELGGHLRGDAGQTYEEALILGAAPYVVSS